MNRVKIYVISDTNKVVMKASLCKEQEDKVQFMQSFKCPDCLHSLLMKFSVVNTEPMDFALAPDGRKDPFTIESDGDYDEDLNDDDIKEEMDEDLTANLYPQLSMTENRLGEVWVDEHGGTMDQSGFIGYDNMLSDNSDVEITNGSFTQARMNKFIPKTKGK